MIEILNAGDLAQQRVHAHGDLRRGSADMDVDQLSQYAPHGSALGGFVHARLADGQQSLPDGAGVAIKRELHLSSK